MDLFGPEKKPLKKKDTSPYYYNKEEVFTKVPSVFDLKEKLVPYVHMCMQREGSDITIEELEEMWAEADAKKPAIIAAITQMKAENEATGDLRRIKAYSNAIRTITKLKVPLVSYDQALKLPGIGKGIAAKISEVIKTGKLRTIEERTESAIKRQKTVEKFMKVWGVKNVTANKWYDKGYRELEDLVNEKLDSKQKVGVEYYDELDKRIPREEVDAIVARIKKVLAEENSQDVKSMLFEVCGSYRRGAEDLGDIDILVTGKSPKVLPLLVQILKTDGIITDTPVLGPKLFMGIALAPGRTVHRRIDIRYIPREDWGAGLLYFTGPQAFNVQMREQAAQMGYRLSEKGLVKISSNGDEEEKIPTETEQDIFDALNMSYLEPKERT